MNEVSYSYIYLLIAATWSCVFSQYSGESCVTPDSRNGECINIRQCQPLLSLLKRRRPLSQWIIRFLTESQCGFEGRDPLVCCPYPGSSPDMKPSEMPKFHIRGTPPKDVTNHPGVKKFLPELCGAFTEERITRGNVSNLYEFPWMALVGYKTRNGLQYRCGGSLINRRYILTAAHCVTPYKNLQLSQIRLGEYDVSTDIDCQTNRGCAPPAQDYGIEEAIPHPDYKKSELQNDIALIRLNADVTMTDAVQPVCLPVGKEQIKNLEGEKVLVTGWGTTEYGVSSPVLLKVYVPIVPTSKCAVIYNKSVPVTAKQLCAGGVDGKDSCSGDSGGPLHFIGQPPVGGGISYVQYGLVSFGPRRCGTQGEPGVYTKIGHYMDWILNTMQP